MGKILGRSEKIDMKIVLLNQSVGPLFRELAEDLAKVWSPSLLYAGHPHTEVSTGNDSLVIRAGPEYDRRSNLKRFFSWLCYFFSALWVVACQSHGALLFIVSNPPFLGLIGLFYKLVRGQKYVVLVYDIYPDLLLRLGTIRRGFISRTWEFLNHIVLENADLVFTIGEDLASLLEEKYDLGKTKAQRAVVVPNWADVASIRPIAKADNWFAKKHGQLGKITVLYSGNMGNSHDIESILEVASELRENNLVHFLFIGEGAKWPLVERTKAGKNLRNITLLPFQPEEVLPFSIPTGDIGVVAYQHGTERCIVPSKAYYYMASGLVPLVVSGKETDLGKMVVDRRCGVAVQNRDIEVMKQAILTLSADTELLQQYKKVARKTAEEYFSRNNTARYVETIRRYDCIL
ncbi:MAG: glycosyltransferase family 4 protein [Deltaproteobacteria bacterium]|nr:glycosyltransferase family 4 protein [Candidatus Deferrimicrobium borealis]